jgi:hypothetical protein
MNSITNLTPQQLRRAADVQERIQALQRELNLILGSPVPTFEPEAPVIKRRKMSAAGRAAIAAAAKARWAKQKGTASVSVASKTRRKITAAGRAALAAAAKARWAKVKALGKKRL